MSPMTSTFNSVRCQYFSQLFFLFILRLRHHDGGYINIYNFIQSYVEDCIEVEIKLIFEHKYFILKSLKMQFLASNKDLICIEIVKHGALK